MENDQVWPVAQALPACRSTAAAISPEKSGWAAVGLLLNSGWNCTATNQG